MAKDFIEEVDNILKGVKPSPQLATKQQDNSLLFLIAVVLLGIGVLVAVNFKQNKFKFPLPIPQVNSYQQPPVENYTDEILQHLMAREKWNSDRLTMMGIAFNNNWAVYHNGFPKSDLIYLNKDWTVNKVPPRVQLTPQDRTFVEGFINQQYPQY
jgi:hypothetical protein